MLLLGRRAVSPSSVFGLVNHDCAGRQGRLGYVLYAVLVHSGWSCERGHYFCYVRAGNGQWYKMDDAKVTACDETAALSQSAYVLFYAREGAWEGGAGGGAAAPVGADPTEPGQPAGDASGRAPGSEESPGDTEVEGMSVEQWRRLQEHSRPKPALELRKVQSALPSAQTCRAAGPSTGDSAPPEPFWPRSPV